MQYFTDSYLLSETKRTFGTFWNHKNNLRDVGLMIKLLPVEFRNSYGLNSKISELLPPINCLNLSDQELIDIRKEMLNLSKITPQGFDLNFEAHIKDIYNKLVLYSQNKQPDASSALRR